MKTYTLADIRALEPCYDPVRYLPEAWQGTLLDVLDCTDCPVLDRIWVAVRLLPSEQVVAFAQDCAAVARGYADKARGGAAEWVADWAIAVARAAGAEWAADWAAKAARDADWVDWAAEDAATAAKARNAARDVEAAAKYAAAERAERNMAAARAAEVADWTAESAKYDAIAADWAVAADLAAVMAAEERDRQIEVLKRLAKEVV